VTFSLEGMFTPTGGTPEPFSESKTWAAPEALDLDPQNASLWGRYLGALDGLLGTAVTSMCASKVPVSRQGHQQP
jgi:hypothetical protein